MSATSLSYGLTSRAASRPARLRARAARFLPSGWRSFPMAARGAGIVICPGTEANLGDGLVDLPRWLAAGGSCAIVRELAPCHRLLA